MFRGFDSRRLHYIRNERRGAEMRPLQVKGLRGTAKGREAFAACSCLFAAGSVAAGSQSARAVGRLRPTDALQAVAYGVDDMTLGFDMEGSASIGHLKYTVDRGVPVARVRHPFGGREAQASAGEAWICL
jgi:hypothetical protein